MDNPFITLSKSCEDDATINIALLTTSLDTCRINIFWKENIILGTVSTFPTEKI